MLYALDIETKCAVKDCEDKSCKHALIPHLSTITCIGVWNPYEHKVFRGPNQIKEFEHWHHSHDGFMLGHNLKWDLKQLYYRGLDIPAGDWCDDTQLMAFCSLDKVSEEYLEWYSEERKKKNKELPHGGKKHRDAGPLSLKTLAPYFLGCPPFWEDPNNHDSDEYVLKDAEYTYQLYEHFSRSMDKECLKFYEEKMMPWSKMLLEAELRGITIDTKALERKKQEAQAKSEEIKAKLDELWKDAHTTYYEQQVNELKEQYHLMACETVKKLKDPKGKVDAVHTRYTALFSKAAAKLPDKLSYDSPAQLKWLLKDYLGLDVTNFSDEESTGKEVLQKLAQEGREDIKLFLEYRAQRKLATAFFPTYEELNDQGVIRCSFNITGTKTGRLSSSSPNLQQVPTDLHSLFVARPGYRLVTRDASYIEPRLIAYFTEDPILCDLILRDGDFHSRNAIIMCGLDCEEYEVKEKYPKERKLAKTVGLALLYGAGPNRLHQTAIQQGFSWNYNHCKEIYQRFKNEYETIFAWKEEFDKAASQRPIKNLLGFKRKYLSDEVYMQGFNGLVQGSASMLIVEAATRIKQKGIQPLLLVHDELICEVPEATIQESEKIIEEAMTGFSLPTRYGNIPLKVEGKTGPRWEK